ncbi:MAG: hypothetical protein JNN07_27945 [Verrucomicrobiales bacterium]|nr:hypothetical protein [Verrucomicrobiales bacterium]
MSERSEKLLKQCCLVLALILLYPTVRLLLRDDGLKSIPTLTMSMAAAAPSALQSPGTNSPAGRPPAAKAGPGEPLPESIRLQVEKITQSEILGPVIRPQPVALMGIAGRDAFIRTANGRTGLLRTGETLDGLKLLQVGTNRVVIEENGVRRELTIFSGLGSSTLLPKTQEKKP